MSLLNIIREVSDELGIDTSSPNDRAKLVDRINRVASDIYNSHDLRWSWRDEIISVDPTEALLSFPHYVKELLYFKPLDNHIVKERASRRARYIDYPEVDSVDKFREVRRTPVHTNMPDDSNINFKLDEILTEDITIELVGKTPTIERRKEVLVIPAGSIGVVSTDVYTEIHTYRRLPNLTSGRSYIESNIRVYDNNATELSVLPAGLDSVSYPVYQMEDFESGRLDSTSGNYAAEILYKMEYVPMIFDSDEFVATSRYDSSIIEAVLADSLRIRSTGENGSEVRATMKTMNDMSEARIKRIMAEGLEDQNSRLLTRTNKYARALRSLKYGGYSRRRYRR